MSFARAIASALLFSALAACQNSVAPQAGAAPTAAPSAPPSGGGAVQLQIDEGRIVLSNGLIERSWTSSPLVRTERLVDLRTGKVWMSDDITWAR